MGYMIKNGVNYYGDNSVSLTQAQYNALVVAGTVDPNTTYYITDSSGILSIDMIYPIGSIFMSVNNVNPSTYLSGTTWVAWGAGRVPVGVDTSQTEFDTVEETGGEKSHTLGIKEIPTHRHTVRLWINAGTLGNAKTTSNYGAGTTDAGAGQKLNSIGTWQNSTFTVAQNGWGDQAGITDVAGADSPHNNLQPYITCYMWKRTA